jgi:hypothetical protein
MGRVGLGCQKTGQAQFPFRMGISHGERTAEIGIDYGQVGTLAQWLKLMN